MTSAETAGDLWVHVVDDDASFLRATARLLRAAGHNVCTYSSTEDYLTGRDPDARGCVIVDLDLPGADGLQLQAALQEERKPVSVVFLSGQGNIPAAVEAIQAGAEDFLTKTAPREDLLGAVVRALNRFRSAEVAYERREELRALFARLTPRELEVLSHVVRGKLNKQTAADLGISERTIKLHRSAITSKLGVFSVAELTRLADEACVFAGA